MKSLLCFVLSICFIQLQAQKIHLSAGGSQLYSRKGDFGASQGLYIEPGLQISKRFTPTFSFSAFKLEHETVLTPKMVLYSGKFQIPVDTLYNVKDDYIKSMHNLQFKFKSFIVLKDKYKIYASPILGATTITQKHKRQHDQSQGYTQKSKTVHFNFGADIGIQYLLIKDKDIYLDVSCSYNCLRNRDANQTTYVTPITPFTNLYNSTYQFRIGISAMLWKINEI